MTPGERYLALLEEVGQIAKRYGRSGSEIEVIPITKNHPWEELASLYQAGARQFGESRLAEWAEKRQQAPEEVQWHLVGTLQRKKAAKAVGQFALIHSVDTPELALKIAQLAAGQGRPAPLLLQVNSSGEPTKHGLSVEEWRCHFEQLLSLTAIEIKGLMTMAPLQGDEATIRRCFASLREFKEELAATYGLQKSLTHLSMGMSSDYPWAIAEGATLLRVGSLLFQG